MHSLSWFDVRDVVKAAISGSGTCRIMDPDKKGDARKQGEHTTVAVKEPDMLLEDVPQVSNHHSYAVVEKLLAS